MLAAATDSAVLAALTSSWFGIADRTPAAARQKNHRRRDCPKQERTLAACHRVLSCAREHPVYLEQLTTTGKLPIAALSAESGVERKTMERHRKYLVALLLAFTNGFEIIRGHLRQMARPVKEVK